MVWFKGHVNWCPTATAGAHLENILMSSSKAAVTWDRTEKLIGLKRIRRTKGSGRRKSRHLRLGALARVKAEGPGTTKSWMGWHLARQEVWRAGLETSLPKEELWAGNCFLLCLSLCTQMGMFGREVSTSWSFYKVFIFTNLSMYTKITIFFKPHVF